MLLLTYEEQADVLYTGRVDFVFRNLIRRSAIDAGPPLHQWWGLPVRQRDDDGFRCWTQPQMAQLATTSTMNLSVMGESRTFS